MINNLSMLCASSAKLTHQKQKQAICPNAWSRIIALCCCLKQHGLVILVARAAVSMSASVVISESYYVSCRNYHAVKHRARHLFFFPEMIVSNDDFFSLLRISSKLVAGRCARPETLSSSTGQRRVPGPV